MHEYEIRVLGADRGLVLSVWEMQFTPRAAIRSGHHHACRLGFEVWRDDVRIYSQSAQPNRRLRLPRRPL